MKIKTLDIHNIASIRDAKIDFDANPLRDSNVFLISGKTGAGKTSILDAICLALYNEVPRLFKLKDREDDDAIIKRDDTRNMMRRGTGEAYVRLTFVGIDNRQYEASWSVCRAHKKVDGKMQAVEWSIKDIVEGTSTNGKKATENKILEVVGLTFDQFCRTTMLAQGEFTKFLKSEPNDKSAILEKIVGVDIYSKVGAKIADITSEKKKAADNAKERLNLVSLFSEEQKAEKQQKIEELNKDNEQKKGVRDSDSKKLQWLKEESEKQQKLKKAQEEYGQAQAAIGSEEFSKSQRLVKQWEETICVRQSIVNKHTQEAAIKEAQEKINGKHDPFVQLIAGVQYIEAQVAQKSEKLNEIEDSLNTLSAEQKDVYEKAETDIAHLTTIGSTKAEIENKQKDLECLKTNLEPLEKAYKDAQDAESIANGKADAKKNEYDAQQKALDDLQRDKTREEEKAQGEIKHKIETAERTLTEYDKACEELKQQNKEIEDREKQLGELNNTILVAEGAKEECKKALDRLCNTDTDTIKKLRLHLLVGDNCPVCQAVFTEGLKANLPSDDAWDRLVSDAETAYNEAEKKYKGLVDAQHELSAQIQAKQGYLADVQTAKGNWESACAELNIEPNKDALDELKKCNENTLFEIDKKLKAGANLEAKVRALQKECDDLRKEYEKALKKTKEQEQKRNDCRNAISGAESALKTCADTITSTEEKLNPNIKKVYAEISDWAELRNTLKEGSERYKKQQKDKDALTQDIEKEKNSLAQAQRRIEGIQKQVPAWNDLSTLVPKQYNGNTVNDLEVLNTAIVGLTTTITNAQAKSKEEAQSIEIWLAQNSGFTEQQLIELSDWSSEKIQAKRTENDRATTEFSNKKTTKENAECEVRSHQESKPVFAEEETEHFLADRIAATDNEINANSKAIGSIEQELMQDDDNRKGQEKRQAEYEKSQADYDKWQRVNSLFGTADGKKFRTIALSYILDYLISAANEYMQQLNERYVLTLTPGTFAINVEDTWSGHTQRGVSTLSGGETFMVSLALALALSDIGSRNLQVDTLFIDEGFGTLSGEALDGAIAMLQNLQSKKGRRVGIISHVGTVKEKIPVHIEVERNGNSSYSTINIVPAVTD